MSNTLRHDMPELPPRIAKLPVDKRGFPVPYFVEWVNGEPDFRVTDSRKLRSCVLENRCWICGDALGVWKVYIIGPMCAINRISAEPPSHLECAEFSVRACPFMTKPHMIRRENDLPTEAHNNANHIPRNPGVMLVWITRHAVKLVRNSDGGVLFDVGEPQRVEAYREARPATGDELHESIASGFPLLRDAAMQEGAAALRDLSGKVRQAASLLSLDLSELVAA